MWTQLSALNMPLWRNAIVIIQLVCLLGFARYWTSVSPPWITTKHHKTWVSRDPWMLLSPSSCLKQVCHQCQSRPAGSSAVPLTKKFQHKTHSNIQTTTLPELVNAPRTTRVFTVTRNCEESCGEWRSSATHKLISLHQKWPDSKLQGGEKS